MRHVAALVMITVVLAVPGVAVAQVQELPNVPIVQSGWQEKFWTHPDGTKFHYFEMGTGTPVILIHGSGGTAANWMANGLAASLAKTNRVLAIDMRGPDGEGTRRIARVRHCRPCPAPADAPWLPPLPVVTRLARLLFGSKPEPPREAWLIGCQFARPLDDDELKELLGVLGQSRE